MLKRWNMEDFPRRYVPKATGKGSGEPYGPLLFGNRAVQRGTLPGGEGTSGPAQWRTNRTTQWLTGCWAGPTTSSTKMPKPGGVFETGREVAQENGDFQTVKEIDVFMRRLEKREAGEA